MESLNTMKTLLFGGGIIGITGYLIYLHYRKEPNIFEALSEKQFDQAKRIISNQPDPKEFIENVQKTLGYPIANILCKDGNLNIVKYIEEVCGKEIFLKRSSDGWFPLNVAIFNNNEEIIPFLLTLSDSKVKYLDDAEHSAVSLATIQRNSKILKHLLDFYEKDNELEEIINHSNYKKQTPLYFACFVGDVECVKILLKKGANPLLADFRGNAPLHASCMSTEGEKTLSLLLQEKVDVDQTKTDGCTPLHVACIKGVKDAVLKLISHGADIYKTDSFGSTPFHHAIVHKRLDIIPIFFKYKDLFSVKDKDGFIPLFTACNYLHDEVLFEEIAKNSEVDYIDPFGSTAIHCACSSSNFNAVKILIEKFNVNLSYRNKNGNTAYLSASKPEIKEYVKKFCSENDLIKGDPELIEQETITVLKEATLEHIGELIKQGTFKNVIVLTGAGISTNANIPDFRSKDTGLYDQIRKKFQSENIKLTPESIFDVNTFKEDPSIFYSLRGAIFGQSDKAEPTKVHKFIKYLNDENILLRNYTQNIDGLERKVGISEDKLVECHGTLQRSHCTNPNCKKEFSLLELNDLIKKSENSVPFCSVCDSVVKPDLVFFGESLPEIFGKNLNSDFKKCDLLIIIGTSLTVFPFSTLPSKVAKTVPRLLINKKVVGDFCFPSKHLINRDVVIDTDCDEAIELLTKNLY